VTERQQRLVASFRLRSTGQNHCAEVTRPWEAIGQADKQEPGITKTAAASHIDLPEAGQQASDRGLLDGQRGLNDREAAERQGRPVRPIKRQSRTIERIQGIKSALSFATPFRDRDLEV
jgi:hypothetical protein